MATKGKSRGAARSLKIQDPGPPWPGGLGLTAKNSRQGVSPLETLIYRGPDAGYGGLLGSPTPSLAAVGAGFAIAPDQWNLYAYMAGNPFAGTDPDGRGAIWDAAKKVGKAALAAAAVLSNPTGEAARYVAASESQRSETPLGIVKKDAEAVGQFLEEHPRIGGTLQVGAAALEVAGGLAATTTGAGAVVGVPLMFHGADNLVAGVGTLITGEAQATLAQKGLEAASESLTGTKAYGTAATIGLDIGAGYASARILVKAGGLRGLLGTDELADLPRPPTSPNYSVEFRAKISSRLYPGRSEHAHFADANRQLHEAFQGDPGFARAMEQRYPGITEHVSPGPRGGFNRSSPTDQGLVWHHHPDEAGVLELIPTAQHTAPGPVQGSLHPQGSGGMNTWGGGRQRRR